jgi:lipid-A-disaccharide synthase-like uncharacterized protein
MMDRWGILIVGLLLVGLHYCVQFLTTKHDPREPPLISPKIPFIGHLVGLLRYGLAYYAKAR